MPKCLTLSLSLQGIDCKVSGDASEPIFAAWMAVPQFEKANRSKS